MTTRELVVRMAMDGFEGGRPHIIWQWPFHYFFAIRREWLKVKGLAPGQGNVEDGVTRRTVGPDITVETYGGDG